MKNSLYEWIFLQLPIFVIEISLLFPVYYLISGSRYRYVAILLVQCCGTVMIYYVSDSGS
jgi:hypothetical protein